VSDNHYYTILEKNQEIAQVVGAQFLPNVNDIIRLAEFDQYEFKVFLHLTYSIHLW
jgi:hypothetical protein